MVKQLLYRKLFSTQFPVFGFTQFIIDIFTDHFFGVLKFL